MDDIGNPSENESYLTNTKKMNPLGDHFTIQALDAGKYDAPGTYSLTNSTPSSVPPPSTPSSQPAVPHPSTSSNPLLSGLNPNARGVRNNNPGNLEANSYTANMEGYTGSDGRFAKFATPEQGIAALKHNLMSYGAQGINTPLGIATRWAPGSEAGNNPSSYGGAIAAALGVGLNDKINMNDPGTQDKIASAIAKVENGGGVTIGGRSSSTNVAPSSPGGNSAPSEIPQDVLGQSADMKSLMQLALIQAAFPQHKFTPINYDPQKVADAARV